MRSFAVLDAADKENYLAKFKNSILQPSQNTNIKNMNSPGTLLPWRRKGKIVSTVKFKKKVEARAYDASYLRRKDHDLYQVCIPGNNIITTNRIKDFIKQQSMTTKNGTMCESDTEEELKVEPASFKQ